MHMHDKVGIAADRLAVFIVTFIRMFMDVQRLF